eukprot:2547923-Prymnesium_polylepis.2
MARHARDGKTNTHIHTQHKQGREGGIKQRFTERQHEVRVFRSQAGQEHGGEKSPTRLDKHAFHVTVDVLPRDPPTCAHPARRCPRDLHHEPTWGVSPAAKRALFLRSDISSSGHGTFTI